MWTLYSKVTKLIKNNNYTIYTDKPGTGFMGKYSLKDKNNWWLGRDLNVPVIPSDSPEAMSSPLLAQKQ